MSIPLLVRQRLQRPLPMTVTTRGKDGASQMSLVWQEVDGEDVVFFADSSSRKVANLRRDIRVSALVVDDELRLGNGVPCYVVVHGHARIGERDDALVQRLTARYMDLPEYPFGVLDPFVAVRIRPYRFGGNLDRGAALTRGESS
jgi:PPOX class probable F420-dependent enzyme